MSAPRSDKLPFFVHRCVRAVAAVLEEAGLRDEHVLLGVSGGGDSMALLEIAGLLAKPLGLGLHVACIDHGLRPESATEANLVARAAERWNASFHAVRVHPAGADEDSLRRARHDALERIRVANGCRVLALGHTADDQIETIVFRFLRGAGVGGLSGMSRVRSTGSTGFLVRPLLGISRDELRRLLATRQVAWVEDPTNTSSRYARGRLRTSVLPAIEEAFGKGALEHLLDVAPRWRADEDLLERETERLLAYASRRGTGAAELDLEALATAHEALRSRALRRWIGDITGRQPTSRDVAGIERWLDHPGENREGRVDIAAATIERIGGRLRIVGNEASERSAARARVTRR